ncbi:MAG: hypothetical protein R6U25_01465 [Alkalispirochaeta sp.]
MYPAIWRCVIEFTLLLILAGIVAALLISLIHLRRSDYSALSDRMAGRSRNQLKVMKPCPLCHTLLEPGETVHTVVYSGEDKSAQDSVVHMFGCPYCYPANARYQRVCPVCRHEIPEDGFVVARMFTKGTRKHVHVLGCTSCRSGAGTGGYRDRRSG